MIAEKLKKAVLQAAIQGKLTEQLPSDGDARDLLQEIQAEKSRLIQEGKIRREKPLPEITENEILFDIPENWIWVRLRNVTSALGDGIHGTPKYDDQGEYRFINGSNLFDGRIIITKDTKNIDASEYFKYKKPLDETTVLVSINGTIGNVAFYNNERIILGKSACYFNMLGNISKNYLKSLIKSDYFMIYALSKATGSTINNVSLKAMRKFPIPLPPLSEQHRIVEKLDGILPELENLTKDETKLESIQKSFPGQIKASILQVAVQGKLTEQLSSDGDARDLLEEIKTEKERLIKQGKIKKKKPIPEISEDEIPFDIPENWCWVRLGNLVNVQTGSKDANWGSSNGQYNFYTCAKEPILSNTYSFEGKSIIMPGNGANVGLSILVDEKFEAYQRTYVLQSLCDEVFLDYIHVVLNADWKILYGGGVYGSAIPYIRKGELTNYVFPLPPLAEQKRIVQRLEELLPLCDALE